MKEIINVSGEKLHVSIAVTINVMPLLHQYFFQMALSYFLRNFEKKNWWDNGIIPLVTETVTCHSFPDMLLVPFCHL